MSQDDRREPRDTEETLELGTAAGTAPTQPLGDTLFGAPAAQPGAPTTAMPESAAATSGPSGATAHDGTAHAHDATEHRADGRAGHPTDDHAGDGAADHVGTAHAPAAGPVEAPRPSRGPRVGTVVWGFLVVACGAAVLASALGAQVDLGLAAIVVLAVAGVTLVVGSVAVGARRRSRS